MKLYAKIENGLPETVKKLIEAEIQNNEGKVWKFMRSTANFVADTTRPIRREAAMLIVPEEVVSNKIEHKHYVDAQSAEMARKEAIPETYCYKSWTGSTCYAQPQEGQEDRRVGN